MIAAAHSEFDLGLVVKILFLVLTAFGGLFFKIVSAIKKGMEEGAREPERRRSLMDLPEVGSSRGGARPAEPDLARRRLEEALGLPPRAGGYPAQSDSHTITVRRRVSRPSPRIPAGSAQRPPGGPPPVPVAESEGPQGRVADLHFPEMRVPVAPKLETVASRVTALSEGRPVGTEKVTPGKPPRKPGGLRARLADREDVRDVLVLGEILGRPRGLQS
jgi:hypothetical protein